ncbi:MAG: hypothetical protein V7641_5015 [Blastocatellia bacterium]
MAKIVTAEVEDKRRELLAALRDAMQASGATRDQAEAQLSSFFGRLWNKSEAFARQLPACFDSCARSNARS